MSDPVGRDIVDAIDELVDEQLAGYSQHSGYDFNINQDKCPHGWCQEPWHGLKITAKLQRMSSFGRVDPAYRHAGDDSETLCPGSAFEGEFTPPQSARDATSYPSAADAVADMVDSLLDQAANVVGLPPLWLGYDDGRGCCRIG